MNLNDIFHHTYARDFQESDFSFIFFFVSIIL